MISVVCVFGILPFAITLQIDACINVNNQYLFDSPGEEMLRAHCEFVLDAASKFSYSSFLLLNDLVPFTVLTEPLFVNQTRRSILQQFVSLVAAPCGTDTACIVSELNEKVWAVSGNEIVFAPAPPGKLNSYGIDETWTRVNGSCTAMSVFLITALRFAGVPARIVGTPHWNNPANDGNHNWVEVYTSSGWSWVDQRRPDKIVLPLNQSWFYPEWTQNNSVPHMGNLSIYAASFMPVNALNSARYPKGRFVEEADWFKLAWDWENHDVPAWDVSGVYGQKPPQVYQYQQV